MRVEKVDAPSGDRGEKGVHEIASVKGSYILQGLSGADEENRYIQFLLDCQGYAAPGRSVQLGQENARATNRLGEGPGLGQAVEPGGGVQGQQHFLGCAWVQSVNYPMDLLQLFHQIGAGMQPAGRIHNQHVGAPCLAGVVRVISHGAGVGPGLVADYFYAHPVTEDFELLLGGGAEGVCGAEDDFLAVPGKVIGELGNAGGLADAVNSDHQNHVGRIAGHILAPGSGRGAGIQFPSQRILEKGEGRVRIVYALAANLLPEFFDDAQGGLNANIGGDQDFFKFFPNRLIQARGAENFQDASEPALPTPFDAFVGLLLVAFPVSLEE